MHILMYHLVQELLTPMAVPPSMFRRQMRVLAEGPYSVIGEDELHAMVLGDSDLRSDAVLITFDDGYRNTVSAVLPVLEKFGLPAMMAVCGGYLTEDRPRRVPHPVQDMADREQVLDWVASGRDVAAHSYTHRRLPHLNDDALHWQIAGDQDVLTDLLGRPPRTFVYPFGAYDARVQRAVSDRYPLALTTDEPHRADRRHPYALPRIHVDPAWSIAAFQAALRSDTDPRTAQQAAQRADFHRPESEDFR